MQLNPAAVSTLTLIDEPLFGFALLFSLVVQSHISSKVLLLQVPAEHDESHFHSLFRL